MRKIDWNAGLSEEDIAWVRQAGFVNAEELIAENAKRFNVKVSDPEVPDDGVTRPTVGVDAVGNTPPQPDPATGAPRRVDPTETDVESEEDDDYDEWNVSELEAEVSARNDIADKREDVSRVEVVGTGANGKPKKPDYVKALRVWDGENPGVLEPSETVDK